MSAKLTLDMAAMQEEFFTDSALVGIASTLPPHRFCWLINAKFNTDFVRDPVSDICTRDAEQNEHFFPVYKYCAPLNGNKYFVYKLKSGKESLMPEIKQLDYLWMIQSNSPEAEAAQIIQLLREIADIQLAQILLPERLRNLSYLLV